MKRQFFMMAAVAVLAMACAKEQQPASVVPSDSNEGLTEICVTVEPTKVAVAEQTGACSWQAGDKMAIFFTTEVNEQDEITAGVKVEFTYDGLYEDGSAKFVTSAEVPETYLRAEATYPAAAMSDKGKKSLVRDYTYNTASVPVYLVGAVNKNEDGAFTSYLTHNASIMKFTLHDIPAYAAGFVLYSKRPDTVGEDGNVKEGTAVTIKTSFPYTTGYTADPANYDNDIVLYSAIAHSSVPQYVYLIDGDGDEIEGSRKNFTGDATVGYNDYVVMPRIDFKKADLRQDYIKVCGVKWAKGNLVRDRNRTYDKVADAGFQEGWGLHDAQWKYIKWDVAGNYDYDNNNFFDLFTYGGIGRQAGYASGRLVPVKSEYDIQAKVFWGYVNEKNPDGTGKSNPENLTELTGDARFSEAVDNSGNSIYVLDGTSANLAGDVAFWASKGKYCLPKKSVIQDLAHATSSKASFQYGKYMAGEVAIYGYLFKTPQGDVVRSNQEVVFTDADLESGLFLPFVGRRGPTSNKTVIGRGTCAIYRSSTLGAVENSKYSGQHSQCARVIWFSNSDMPVYGFTSGSSIASATDYSSNCTLSVAAGGCIRPILYEE